MAIDDRHPRYDALEPDWRQIRDLYDGETTVKNAGESYLPMTNGMRLDGDTAAYDAYKLRALFPEYVSEAVAKFVGMLHQKPVNIVLPERMEPLRENATAQGESLELLLRNINEKQLVEGRCGLLLDLPLYPDPTEPIPYIALYDALSVLNWDDAFDAEGETRLNLVVLDESGVVREGFEWDEESRFRVLQLGDLNENEPEGESRYLTGLFEDEYDESALIEPQLRGVGLQQIPFVFCNSKNLSSEPEKPPLAGLGNLSLAIYRGEADYRQNLFMQGQDTLVVVGRTSEVLRTGAGSMIEVDIGGDVKFVGIGSAGLSEQREALTNDRRRAETLAGQLIDTGSRGESGTALQTRIAAQSTTLTQIALAGAGALERILRICAVWMGLDPLEVSVTPNLDFAVRDLPAGDLVQLMTARTLGAPLSLHSIHALMARRGLSTLTFDEEHEWIQDENDTGFFGEFAGADSLDDSADEGEQDAANGAADTTGSPVRTDVQASALNGAQVASMVAVLKDVAAKLLPAESAIAILIRAFQMTPQEASEMVNPAAEMETALPPVTAVTEPENDEDEPAE